MSSRDSIGNTIKVTVLLCLICSVAVSGAAVALRDMQERNAKLYKQENILKAAGLVAPDASPSGDEIQSLFETRITVVPVELKTGRDITEKAEEKIGDLSEYDQIDAAGSPKTGRDLSSEEDVAGIARLEHVGLVYKVLAEDGKSVDQYVLPVRGYGLWSTMKGFLSLASDTKTIKGITFYEHEETPGLGGEIESDKFQEPFRSGKKVAYDDDWNVAINVTKTPSEDAYDVDALSGATITSDGVTNMLEFWLGGQGYGPYLERERDRKGEPDSDGDTVTPDMPDATTPEKS